MRRIKSQAERFWGKVDKVGPTPAHAPDLGPCWVWIGCRDRKGYGRFQLGRADGVVSANRWSLGQALGRAIAPGLFALHHCDNSSCVNPTHIYEGSPLDNVRDMISRGRRVKSRAKLTEDAVRYIRSRAWVGSKSQRDLARELGVTDHIVSRILSNHIWRDVV